MNIFSINLLNLSQKKKSFLIYALGMGSLSDKLIIAKNNNYTLDGAYSMIVYLQIK